MVRKAGYLGGIILIVFIAHARGEEKIIAVPAGTIAKASFGTEAGKGAEALLDGDESTFMHPAGGTCTDEEQITSVFFTFPAPIKNLAGVVTGASDKFHNYYPKRMEFWVDTDGDGKFETPAGATEKLGGGDRAKGKHLFDGRVPKTFALELRVTRQNIAGGKRAWFMNEIKLVISDEMSVLKPNKGESVSYEIFKDQDAISLPRGTKVSASFKTEAYKGPELLFDGDVTTFMVAAEGTCMSPDQVTSIFLRFPKPVKNLAGIITGASDKFHNYYDTNRLKLAHL